MCECPESCACVAPTMRSHHRLPRCAPPLCRPLVLRVLRLHLRCDRTLCVSPDKTSCYTTSVQLKSMGNTLTRPSNPKHRASASSQNNANAEDSPKRSGSSTSTNLNNVSGSRADNPAAVDGPKKDFSGLGKNKTGPGKIAMAKAAAAGVAGKNLGKGALNKAMQQLFPSLPEPQSSARSAVVIFVETTDPEDMTMVVDFPEGAYWMAQDLDPEKTNLSALLAEALNGVTRGLSKKGPTVIATHLRDRQWTDAECATITDKEGRVLVAVRLPPMVPLPTIPYPDFMTRVAEHQSGFRSSAREAFFTLVSSMEPSPPIWIDDGRQDPEGGNQDPEGGNQTLASELEAQTLMTLQELAKALSSIHVVVDDTGNGPLKTYALPNARAVSHITSYVGRCVSLGDLDKESEQLYLSLLQRHDRYSDTFHDAGPELLHLRYGPSQKHPDSHCLSAVLTSNPSIRMDVGLDSTFSRSLRSAEPSAANLRRRLHAAVREETRIVRYESMITAPPECACCQIPLSNLRERQGLPAEDQRPTELGTYDHVDSVAAISARYCEILAAPELLLQDAPNHHLFRASTARDQVSAALRAEGAGRWLCGPCHIEVTRVSNRENAASSQEPSSWEPPPMPELAAWWVVATLGRTFGTIAPPLLEPSSHSLSAYYESVIANLEADNDALADRLLQTDTTKHQPRPSSLSPIKMPSSSQTLLEQVYSHLPQPPETPTRQSLLFAGAILAAHLLSSATGAVLAPSSPLPSPPPSPTTEDQESMSSTQPAKTKCLPASAKTTKGQDSLSAAQSSTFSTLGFLTARTEIIETAKVVFYTLKDGEVRVLSYLHLNSEIDTFGDHRQRRDTTIRRAGIRATSRHLKLPESWRIEMERRMEEKPCGHAACSEDHPSKRERHDTYVWGVQLSESQASMPVRITNAGKDYSISDKDGSAYGGIQAETLEWRKLRELVDGIHARGQYRYASAVEKAVSVSLESQTKRSVAYSESCAPDTTLVEIAKVFFCNEDGEVLCFKAEGRDYFDGPGTTREERDDSLQQAVRRGLKADLNVHPSWLIEMEAAMEGCPLGHAACSLPPPNPLGEKREHHHIHVWATRISSPMVNMPVWAPEKKGIIGTLAWRKLTDLVEDLESRGLSKYAATIEEAVQTVMGCRTNAEATVYGSVWNWGSLPFESIKKRCQCPYGCPSEPEAGETLCDDCEACGATQGNHGCRCQSENCDGRHCDGIYNDKSDDEEVKRLCLCGLERGRPPSGNPPPSFPPSPHGSPVELGPTGTGHTNYQSPLLPKFTYTKC